MTKVTLDKNMFKALASETRLDILRNLDGKKLTLKDISNVTNLNKATLHEHLFKLHKAGLVKRREREGHKWVYYKLSWKGNSLLHPENNRIVVMLFRFNIYALSWMIIYYIVRNFIKPTNRIGDFIINTVNRVIINKTKGPRLAALILIIGRDKIIKLLNQIK